MAKNVSMQFLEEVSDEKVCLIIPGFLGRQIAPRLHPLSQVDSIFIYCGNKKHHEGWVKDWSKIKGIFTKIEPLCEALIQASQQCEQNAISISIIGDGADEMEKSGDRLDSSFMYTQIMKEILLTITFEEKHFDEFIRHCREAFADNEEQLKYVDELAHKYRQHTPIWWYTCECFLYPMLNRALRAMSADLMIKMGFFISDLHRHIEKLHQEQFGGDSSKEQFTVYRGQGMDKEAFKKMVENKGGLISFNSFLSTSKNRSTSLGFAQSALTNVQLVGVLFVMNIDPTRSSTPFASVVDVGYFGGQEDEVLFSMHSVFRIGEITSMCGNTRLVQVQLNLASDKDNNLRQLIDYIRDETFPESDGWYRLGQVLWKIGESAKAEQVYDILLKQETEESAKAPIYHQLGLMRDEQGEFPQAIRYYEKSIEIQEKQVPRNDLSLAMSYNNIGSVYYSMGDYPKALSSYENALTIQQQSLSPTDPYLAAFINNIGSVYDSMGDYPKALSSYEKALIIQQESLPPNHPDLAMSYKNIGNVYAQTGDYPKALLSYEKALPIQQQSLPPTHPELATTYNNIGNVYRNMGDYSKGLSSYEKALSIQQQSLPPTHPGLATCYNNIGNVYNSTGDHRKALSSYEKALAIQQQSLPPTHPHLALSYNNIGNVYAQMNDYPRALLSHEKALAIRQQSFPPTHSSLAMAYGNIGFLHEKMSNYSKAHACFERALDIAQRSLPTNHPDLQNYRTALTHIKQKL